MIQFNSAEKPVVAALTRLKSPEMAPLLAFLKNQTEQTKTALLHASGNEIYQLQGRGKLLEEILTAVEKSTAVIERMR